MAILRPTSQLESTDKFESTTLLKVSEKNTVNNSWSSRKLTGETLTNAILNSSGNYLNQKYGLPNENNPNYFPNITNAISTLLYGNNADGIDNFDGVIYDGRHDFSELPHFGGELESFEDEYNDTAVNLKTLKNFEKAGNSLLLNSGSVFTTTYNNIENQELKFINEDISQAPSTDSDKHNQYIFQIVGYESNVWEAPADGMFTCFGWVDEKNFDSIDSPNASRWIALEGLFITSSKNDNGEDVETPYWKILNLQPVIPNAFCSYVSFQFPVNKGMKLRLESGFNVGTNSDKYYSTQGSLTNHIPNSFIGGIYLKNKWEYESGTETSPAGVFYEDKYLSSVTNNFNPTSSPYIPSFGNNLQLTFNLANSSSPITTTIDKTMFVAWLSASIWNALSGLIPRTIVSDISSSNLNIVLDENNIARLSSTIDYHYKDVTELGQVYRLSTVTDGDTVKGETCERESPTYPTDGGDDGSGDGGGGDSGGDGGSGGGDDGGGDDSPTTQNHYALFLKVPVCPCDSTSRLTGNLEQYSSNLYIIENQTTPTFSGDILSASDGCYVSLATLSSLDDIAEIQENYSSAFTNYITALNNCAGQEGHIDGQGNIVHASEGHFTGEITSALCDSSSECYISDIFSSTAGESNGFSPIEGLPGKDHNVCIEVNYDEPTTENVFHMEYVITDSNGNEYNSDILDNGVEYNIDVPACHSFTVRAVVNNLPDDEEINNIFCGWRITDYTRCNSESLESAENILAGITSTYEEPVLIQKKLNEDEKNYSKLINDIKKEIED